MAINALALSLTRATPKYWWASASAAETALEEVFNTLDDVPAPPRGGVLIKGNRRHGRSWVVAFHRSEEREARDAPHVAAVWDDVVTVFVSSSLASREGSPHDRWSSLERGLLREAAFERLVRDLLVDYLTAHLAPPTSSISGFVVDGADLARVESYLRSERIPREFLDELRLQLRSYFPNELRARLEIVDDPEDGSSELFALVELDGPAPDAYALIDTFDHEWWLAASQRVRHRINVDVEVK
jgi:hypothetical protein